MRKIILKGITGSEKSVFLDSEKNLCMQSDGGEKEVIFSNSSSEFDVYQNELGKIHIALQDESGNLFYLLFSENKWLNFNLLKSKNAGCKFADIKLFDINGNVNLFYSLKHGERYLLIHHKIDLQSTKKPNVLDYAENGKYSAFADGKGNIHILYKNETGRFMYRIYNAFAGEYSHKPLNIDEETEAFCGICGYNSEAYIAYVTRSKTHYSVVFYSVKNGEKKTIGFGTDSVVVPYMYTSSGSIVVAWKERYSCYSCSTKDFGKTFSKTNFLGSNAINTIIKDCSANTRYA